MTVSATQRVKIVLGLVLGLGIGALCRMLVIPSPAPSGLAGALLVVSMTLGYSAADWWLGAGEARHEPLCGGPDGSIKSDG